MIHIKALENQNLTLQISTWKDITKFRAEINKIYTATEKKKNKYKETMK